MAHDAEGLYKSYFLDYASYVIRERAIPDLVDGLKPVQRRILHTLFEMDDGRFTKVANVVGQCMKYHPHGDSSIYTALVTLANADLFIEKQGNYGNFLTGDGAAAARYIECRLFPFAKKILYNPELTEFVDSYDGRSREPVLFPAKIPVAIIQGVQGIAVGMSTMILPHNLIEVIEAQEKALRGEEFVLYPDCPGGGIIDVTNYDDGKGFVTIRARLDTSDSKKVVITELPFGVTSEQMIESIEDANKKGKLKISTINDFTAEKANIEINLQRNTYTEDVVDALYAYTKCQVKVAVNPLMISDNMPQIFSLTEIINYHANHLLDVLRKELELDIEHLTDRLHARTLERIFIEERIYKRIENKKTAEAVNKAVITGFEPFKDQLIREVSAEDCERLLKIPIRRISLFDIEKNRDEIAQINAGIEDDRAKLANIIDYALSYLEDIKKDIDRDRWKRRSEISTFKVLDAKEVAVRNLELRYDKDSGYIGTSVKGGEMVMKVSPYDKIFYMRKDGCYRVINVSEKEYIGTEGLFMIDFADKDKIGQIVFTVIFRDKGTSFYFIDRFQISSFTTGKLYSSLADGNFKLVKLSMAPNALITAKYETGHGYRKLEESFRFTDFTVHKSPRNKGVCLVSKKLQSFTLKPLKDNRTSEEMEPTLFDTEGKSNE
jgi:Type IIA topoisomerase (DNA gyrase/topo II, topoisomerase IV), A subunit